MLPESIGKIESAVAGRRTGHCEAEAAGSPDPDTQPDPVRSAPTRRMCCFAVGRDLLAREIGGRKSYRLLGIGADQLGAPGGGDLLALADDGANRRDDLEAAIDDLHARLGSDALQSGRMFTASTVRSAMPHASAPG